MERKGMRGGFSIFVRKFRYCKGTKTTTDFTVMYWLQKDTCHWYGRTGHDAEVEVCKATPAEAGEKVCYVISKIFILQDQNFSADSNYTKTKQKNLYILGLPYLFPFYPSRKKISSQRLYQTCQNKRMFLYASLINQLLPLQETLY